jgi:chromosome partitioning protein
LPGKVISVVNMKGGVGKTTTVVSLGETLAADENKSVLVVDIDTQANASHCLAGDQMLAELISSDKTIDDFFRTRLVANIPCPLSDFVRDNISHVTHLDHQINVSLVPSSPYLRVTEREIIHELTKRKYSMGAIEGRAIDILKSEMAKFRKKYDFVIFDCAPGISAFTTAAIAISDLIIIPTIPDFLSFLGLSAFVNSVLKEVENRKAQPKASVLVTRKNGTNQHNIYHERIKALSERPDAAFSLFKTVIPESAAFPQAMQMIDAQYPTYRQKYSRISETLADLTNEVRGIL